MDTRSLSETDLLGLFVRLWQETLNDPELGPEDNFFIVGGHSLLALRLLGRVHKYTGVELTLAELLDAPTPAELVAAHGETITTAMRQADE